MTVEQGIIDDFNKKYAENCNQIKMRKKHRNVSPDNPFDPVNKPPDQYIIPEKVCDPPGRHNFKSFDVSKVPLAGKLGMLGQKILSGNYKQAKRMTDYNWEQDCLMTEQIPRAQLGKKPPNPITEKNTQIDMKVSNY